MIQWKRRRAFVCTFPQPSLQGVLCCSAGMDSAARRASGRTASTFSFPYFPRFPNTPVVAILADHMRRERRPPDMGEPSPQQRGHQCANSEGGLRLINPPYRLSIFRNYGDSALNWLIAPRGRKCVAAVSPNSGRFGRIRQIEKITNSGASVPVAVPFVRPGSTLNCSQSVV